jgi:hypothetical protein
VQESTLSLLAFPPHFVPPCLRAYMHLRPHSPHDALQSGERENGIEQSVNGSAGAFGDVVYFQKYPGVVVDWPGGSARPVARTGRNPLIFDWICLDHLSGKTTDHSADAEGQSRDVRGKETLVAVAGECAAGDDVEDEADGEALDAQTRNQSSSPEKISTPWRRVGGDCGV